MSPAVLVDAASLAAAAVLAHAGGVDEGLTIALPLLIFGGFMLAQRRARRRERERAAEGDPPADGTRPG